MIIFKLLSEIYQQSSDLIILLESSLILMMVHKKSHHGSHDGLIVAGAGIKYSLALSLMQGYPQQRWSYANVCTQV